LYDFTRKKKNNKNNPLSVTTLHTDCKREFVWKEGGFVHEKARAGDSLMHCDGFKKKIFKELS